MKKKLNDQLIHSIKNAVPVGTNIADLLMDILYIGKDAIYRRMRGEVSFTLEELFIISNKLNISLDNVLDLNNSKRVLFDLKLPQTPDLIASYISIIEEYTMLYRNMNKFSNSKILGAYNIIPHSLYSYYETLSKFRLFRWLSQTQSTGAVLSMSQINIPKSFTEANVMMNREASLIKESSLILDKNVFSSFVLEVSYFRRLDLIKQEEADQIKEELFALLSTLEVVAQTGVYAKTNQKITLYLSNINFETSYYYYECSGFEISDFPIYSINSINSQNTALCSIQKGWIDSLKRFSTLITQSGEITRREFFAAQKKMISEIF